MIRTAYCLVGLFAVSSILLTTDSVRAEYPIRWKISEGLQAPESAYLDQESGFLFLSQIGDGGGKAKDGDGWISKLSPGGTMIKNKWVTGLNAPKGLRSHGGTLWISDIDRIVAVDIAKGEISKVIEIENAKFLNDLATGPDGAVYVSDMVASKIYKHHDGKTTVVAEGPQLEHPNGLLVVGDQLILGGWGSNFNPNDFSTDPVGNLLSLDLKSGKVRKITKGPTGHLDGIEIDGKGGFYVSDWIDGKVFHIDADGNAKEIMGFAKGAADHAYLVDQGLLILPHMLDGTLTAFEVK